MRNDLHLSRRNFHSEAGYGQAARYGLWGASLLALAVATPQALAAEYHVTTEAQLRAVIADLGPAGTNTDPNPVIILDNDIAVSSTPFSALDQPLTINTNGNILSGADGATGASIIFDPPTASGSLTIVGALEGGDSATNTVTGVIGGTGLSAQSITITNNGTITGGDGSTNPNVAPAGKGGTGLRLENGTLINNAGATILGGVGGESAGTGANDGPGGTGAVIIGGTAHVNNGTIQGGAGPGPGAGTFLPEGRDPIGLALIDATLVNNGTIQGGTPTTGTLNADGIYLDSSTIINNSTGVIKGGPAPGTSRSGEGVTITGSGDSTVINYGLISAGDFAGTQGGHGIVSTVAGNHTIVNFGTISGRGSTSNDLAIRMNAGSLTLELHGSSVIDGKVQANAAVLNDILRLAGDVDDSFDVSQINVTVGLGPPPPQQYLNFNTFEKTGTSTWTIEGVALNLATPSPWDIYEGTLLMSAGSDLGNGVVDVFGGILAGVGTVGPTINHGPSANGPGGTIAPGINGIGTLTVDGAYTGSGGLYAVETVLGDDSSPTDLLAINGGTSGNTFVRVTNLGGAGAQTEEGIKIVDFDADESGAESSAGIFELLGDAVVNGQQAVLGGAYAYSLFQGSVSDPADGDWYLRSIGFTPSATAYESYAGVLLGLIDMPTMQQRVGNVYMPNAGSTTDGYVNPEPVADVVEATPTPPPANFWTRFEAAYGHHEGDSDTGTEYDLDRYKVQVGIDGRLGESADGIFIAGLNAQYGHADADLESDTGDGDNSTDSYGGGVTLTWVSASGFYADAQGQVHYLESDLSSDVVGDLVDNNEGWGYGLSLELGRKVALDDSVSLTPQAQLAYTSVDFDDFTDELGVDVSLDEGESLKGRFGIALNHDSYDDGDSRGHVYAIANVTYEFLDAQSVDIAGVEVEFEPEEFGGELGLGGTYEWAGGTYALHGEALGQTSFEGSYGVKGTAGFSARF
jgi:outer membrane autotransporter protein